MSQYFKPGKSHLPPFFNLNYYYYLNIEQISAHVVSFSSHALSMAIFSLNPNYNFSNSSLLTYEVRGSSGVVKILSQGKAQLGTTRDRDEKTNYVAVASSRFSGGGTTHDRDPGYSK